MRKRWIWLTGVVGCLLTLLGLDLMILPGAGYTAKWLIKLPHEQDPRLVGTWKGKWYFFEDPEPRSRVTEFRANGRGAWTDSGRRVIGFDWGTENGVLYTRRMATDAWSGTSHPYTISSDGKSVTFGKIRFLDLVSESMHAWRQTEGRKDP